MIEYMCKYTGISNCLNLLIVKGQIENQKMKNYAIIYNNVYENTKDMGEIVPRGEDKDMISKPMSGDIGCKS